MKIKIQKEIDIKDVVESIVNDVDILRGKWMINENTKRILFWIPHANAPWFNSAMEAIDNLKELLQDYKNDGSKFHFYPCAEIVNNRIFTRGEVEVEVEVEEGPVVAIGFNIYTC